jgi:undecaprenyl-diphosphatase
MSIRMCHAGRRALCSLPAMDSDLFAAINGLAGRQAALDAAAVGLTSFGPYFLVAGLLGLWLWPGTREQRDRRQRAVLLAAIATSVAMLLNQGIIRVWARPRPFMVRAATVLVRGSGDPSFPSDHATFVFGVVTALLITFRRGAGAWAAFVLAVLIAISRIYVGQHYPTDVVGGAVIGAGFSLAISPAMPRIERVALPLMTMLRRLRLA